METLLSKRATFPRACAQKFRNNNYTTDSPSCLILWRSAYLWVPTSSRKLGLHSSSRSLDGGAHFNEESRTSWPLPERTRGLRCRANPGRSDLHYSDSYEGIDLNYSNSSEEQLGNSSSVIVLGTAFLQDGSDDEAGAVRENLVTKVIRALGKFVSANFLIVALSSSVLLGLAWPAPGQAAQQMGLTKWCTSAIFLLSGLNIRNGEAEQGVAAWPAGVFGLVSILFITPFAAIPILWLQSSPRELVAGLAIFACAPTTLSSAVCLTQIAGANMTLAIGMTVFSNLMSVVTMPFTLTTLVGGGIGVSIPPRQLLQSLLQTLLVPLVLGKIIRETFPVIRKLVDGNRRQVSMVTASFQSLVPWMQLSTSKEMLLQIEPSNLLIIAAAGLALHIVYLATNFILMKLVPSPCIRDDYNSRAVLLVTSQKSIVVSIAVIDRLGGAFGNAGLLVLPCIAAQFSQVIMDSILVNSWVQTDEGIEQSLLSCSL